MNYIAHISTPTEPAFESSTLSELNSSIQERIATLKEERKELFVRVLALHGLLSLTVICYLYTVIATPEDVRDVTIALCLAVFIIVTVSMFEFAVEYGKWWKLPRLTNTLQLHRAYREWRIEYDRQNAPDTLIALR